MQEPLDASTSLWTTTIFGSVGRFAWNSFFYQTFASYSFKYSLIWVAGLLSFLPLFMNVSDYVETTIVAASLRNGTMYYESSILSVGFVGILAIDLLMDVYNSWFGNKEMNEKKAKFMIQRMTNAENFLLLLGLLIQPIVAFLPRTLSNLTAIWFCCQRCQNILVFGTIFLSWCRLYPEMWTPSLTSLALSSGVTGLLLYNFAQFFVCEPSVSIQSIGDKMYLAGQIFLYVAVVFFMSKAMVWLYRTGRKLLLPSIEKKETFTTNKLPTSTDKSNEESIFSFGYILFTFISLILIFITNGGMNLLQLTPTGLLQNNIAFIIMELCFINFYLRQVQFEAIVNLCRLIEAKRAYVRYISHELRTPLNSAFLGIKMILDQLRASEDPVDKERYETLWDVYRACMTTVDILNDLMCYDKIESGILVLHKEDLTPLPFLQECFNGFRAEAQERGVTLNFNPFSLRDAPVSTTSQRNHGNDPSLPLTETDMIHADRFKVSEWQSIPLLSHSYI